MGTGASVWQGGRRSLSTLYNVRVGAIIVNGQSVLYNALVERFAEESSDTDMDRASDTMMADHYINPGHPRYEKVYDRVFGSDTEAEIEEEEIPYWEPYDGPLADSPPWEPITNTRGNVFETFDDDWIPDFETEYEN